MARPRLMVLLAASLLVLATAPWPASCRQKPLPVLLPVAKDPTTSLYTVPIRLDANLVLDLAGPLVWSTCAGDHLPASFSCKSSTCRLANAYGGGCGGGDNCDKAGLCRAHPYNPVTGACATGASLVHSRLVANTTDGRNPVRQVSVRAVKACAPTTLLGSLPLGATGVAGLANSGLALPAQVASSQKVSRKFILCLPRTGYGDGVAIFGGGPLYLLVGQPEYTSSLEYTPLVSTNKDVSPAYHVSVKSIALDNTRLPIQERTLATGGAVLCIRAPYTLLRPDVHRPFMAAFRKAMAAQNARETKSPVVPFTLCYDTRTLFNTRTGYLVPAVTLTLGGGSNWTMTGTNSMVVVTKQPNTACLAFAEMKDAKAGAPAILVGGFQMENFVLEFDLERKRLGFLRLPFFTQCGHFNFTRSS